MAITQEINFNLTSGYRDLAIPIIYTRWYQSNKVAQNILLLTISIRISIHVTIVAVSVVVTIFVSGVCISIFISICIANNLVSVEITINSSVVWVTISISNTLPIIAAQTNTGSL